MVAAYHALSWGPAPDDLLGAVICLVAIFLPGFLLLLGALPFCDSYGSARWLKPPCVARTLPWSAFSARLLYSPVWTSAVLNSDDFALALTGFIVLAVWKVPPWAMGGIVLPR